MAGSAISTSGGDPLLTLRDRLRLIGCMVPDQLALDMDGGDAYMAEAQVIKCTTCRDLGWYLLNVPRWDPEFGKLQPCGDCGVAAARDQRVIRKVWDGAAIPPEYEHVSFESFARLPIYEPTYEYNGETVEGTQPAALEVARAFAASDDQSSILLYGKRKGTGKTATAICIAREIVERTECSVLFVFTIDFLDRIRATYNDDSEVTTEDVMRSARTVDLLILDDIGAEAAGKRRGGGSVPTASPWVIEKFSGLVNYRQTHHKRTIYTSNLSISELGEKFDERLAWRVKDHCDPYIVRVDGKNFRDMSRAERAKLTA